MNKDFNLTSKDYADLLGITTDTLRKRRRRGTETNFIQDEQGNYWWQRSRPKQEKKDVNVPSKNGLFRVPMSKKIDTRRRNRGALARGDKSDYPNWRFEEANKIKALAKIRDKLGDEIVDEITPELFKLAKKRVQDRKQKELDKQLNKSSTPVSSINGIDHTPLKYGSMLNNIGIKELDRRNQEKEYQRWRHKTDIKFLDNPGPKVPDFYSSGSRSNKPGPYEIGGSYDDGSIEVNPSPLSPDERPRFKTAGGVEESIWRARQVLKNKK